MNGQPSDSYRARAAAMAVHIFTASGAALGLLALFAAAEQRWTVMFWWLSAALVVDGVDGAIARKADVARHAPRYSGEVLDLVVDYLTYVAVPAYALATSGLLPQGLGVPAALLVAVTSALYFADARMKTADNYFLGFPGIWNVVAFYLFLMAPPPWLAASLIALFVGMSFMPVAFVHPFRVRRWRALNLVLLVLGALLAAYALWSGFSPPPWVRACLLLIALWFLAAGFLRRPAS